MNTSFDCNVIKQVSCQHCDHDFNYPMTRTITITADQASDLVHSLKALAPDIKQQMASEFEEVPCPNCGRYQSVMLKDIRRRKFETSESFCLAMMIMMIPLALMTIGYPLGVSVDDDLLVIVNQISAILPALLMTLITFVLVINTLRLFYTLNRKKAIADAAAETEATKVVVTASDINNGSVVAKGVKQLYKNLPSLDKQVDQQLETLVDEGQLLDTDFDAEEAAETITELL